MKIGQKKATSIITPNRFWLAFSLLIFVVGVAVGKWGLSPALAETAGDYWSGLILRLGINDGHANELQTLTIDMPFANYNLLLAQREEALETAVFLAAESDFLTADIRLNDQTLPIRLRLRQGVADHLGEDDKWNFDVRVRDGRLLLGMSRFYLVDPADNNWLNEWAFMQALRREEIMVPRYHFVRLILNGDDRGIYALQEGFGPELMTNQGRPEGVIVEFDPTYLWQSIAYFESGAAAGADPVANLTADDFLYFEVDAFRDATIARDEMLTAQKDTAIGLLRGLQNGELAAADVFDAERYGRFLALADLWGAAQATSPANLRYYFHPGTGKLEPIGFTTAPVLDNVAERISLAAAYNDPAIQTAYVTAVEQFIQPDYLTTMQAELETEWQKLAQALSDEMTLAPPWGLLTQRQELLRRSLNPTQSVLAYVGPSALSVEAVIQVDVANILNLPVEIVGFDIDGAVFLEADRAWLQGEPVLLNEDRLALPGLRDGDTAVLHFARFHIPLAKIWEQNSEIDFNHDIPINIATRILGQEQIQLAPAAVR